MDYIISFSEWLQANPQLSAIAFVIAFAAILAVGIPGGNIMMLSNDYDGVLAVTGRPVPSPIPSPWGEGGTR